MPVEKCANPKCNSEFRELSKGKLFLLPPYHYSESLSKYCYWLCPQCSKMYTVIRMDTEIIISDIGGQREIVVISERKQQAAAS